jgi:site-specific DNA-adenine methylase
MMKEWFKERWELIVGFLVGGLGVLALFLGQTNQKKMLKGKDVLHKGTRDVLEDENTELIDKIDSANKRYDESIEKIRGDKDNKLKELKNSTLERKKELEKKTPEELAEEMARVIEKSIIDHS